VVAELPNRDNLHHCVRTALSQRDLMIRPPGLIIWRQELDEASKRWVIGLLDLRHDPHVYPLFHFNLPTAHLPYGRSKPVPVFRGRPDIQAVRLNCGQTHLARVSRRFSPFSTASSTEIVTAGTLAK
jgi:hypothetical protein